MPARTTRQQPRGEHHCRRAHSRPGRPSGRPRGAQTGQGRQPARRSRSPPPCSARGTTRSARQPRPERSAGPAGPLRRRCGSWPGTDRWGAEVTAGRTRAVVVHRGGVGRSGQPRGGTTRGSRSGGDGHVTWSWRRAPGCTSGAAARCPAARTGAELLAAVDALRDETAAAPRSAGGRVDAGGWTRVLARHPCGTWSPPPDRRSPAACERERAPLRRPGTSSSRGRGRRGRRPRTADPRHVPRPRPSALPGHRRAWASTSSTSRRSTRSARTYRKGRNNTAAAAAARRRRLALGDRLADGGHDASTPSWAPSTTSTAFVAARPRAGPGGRPRLRAAVLARTTRGSHEHPEWFTDRAPTAPIAYAENPPKKYQDIYPINFDNDPDGLVRRDAARPAASGWSTACGSSASTTRTPSR